MTYVLDKSRRSIRRVPPYSEERLAAAREDVYKRQTKYSPATQSANGLMSAADKTKLDLSLIHI